MSVVLSLSLSLPSSHSPSPTYLSLSLPLQTQFICMAKGKDTMIPVAKTETFTPVDGLQLGQTDISSEEMVKADKELRELQEKVKQVQSFEFSPSSQPYCKLADVLLEGDLVTFGCYKFWVVC